MEIYFEDDKLKKKMDYANKLGFDKVIIVGEDEVSSNIYKVKDMESGNINILTL